MRTPRAIIGMTLVAALGLSACGGGDDEKLTQRDRAKAAAAALTYVGGGAVTDTERADSDDRHAYEVEVTLPGGTDVDVELDDAFEVTNSPAKAADLEPSATSGSAGPTAASGASGSVADRALTGRTLRRASAAALTATGGGRVTETSGSDDADHAYEVEVLLDGGEDVTVELDKRFKVTKLDR